MPASVFLAVLLAALLHASWNAMVKGGDDKLVSMAGIVLGHVPLAALAIAWFPVPAPAAWPWLAAGVGLHIGYQTFLLTSYRIGDLSQVYPMARGVAPLIVAGISVLLLGVRLPSSGLAAIAIIALGLISLSFVRGAQGLANPRAAAMALATGGFIAAYSLVDGTGARLSGGAVAYYAWLSVINAALFSILIALRDRHALARLRRDALGPALLGGSASFIAYAIVVWAFTQAPIALVTALRETSIVFALLIGVLVLKERLNLVKVAATMATLIGAALLRLAR